MCTKKETVKDIFQKDNIIQPLAIKWIKAAGHAEAFSKFMGEHVTGRVLGRLTNTGQDYTSRLNRAKIENEFDVILQNDLDMPQMTITWIRETGHDVQFAEAVAQQVRVEILSKINEKPPQLSDIFPSTDNP